MAVPKRKTSKTRRDKRRTHFKLATPTVVHCKNCGASIHPHQICRECGFYKGKEFIKVD